MDCKKLGVLITTVDLGSFSKASEVVGYTQSGLTHLMDSLEREIGVRLLNRTHSGVTLTKEGEALMPAIRELMRANTQLEKQIENLNARNEKTIRVAAYSSIAMHWMPEILYRFRRCCPDVQVDLRMVDHALEPFELLEEGKTDVIFASRQQKYHCDWTPLYEEKMYAILPKCYAEILKDAETFPIKNFAEKDFLMPYGQFDLEVNAAFEKVGIHPQAKTSHVDDETVIRMVGRGLGVSMMTEFMIRGRTDDVLCIPVDPVTVRELGMGYHAALHRADEVVRLKECVLSFIRELIAENKNK